MEELLHAQRQDRVIHARGHVQPGQMEGGGRTRTRVFGINHRNAADPHLAQHDLAANALLAGNQAGHRVADRSGLQRLGFDTSRAQGVVNGLAGQVLHAPIDIFSKTGHARTNHGDLSHTSLLSKGNRDLLWIAFAQSSPMRSNVLGWTA